MSSIPTGTELARPFMPAKDFDYRTFLRIASKRSSTVRSQSSMQAPAMFILQDSIRKSGPETS